MNVLNINYETIPFCIFERLMANLKFVSKIQLASLALSVAFVFSWQSTLSQQKVSSEEAYELILELRQKYKGAKIDKNPEFYFEYYLQNIDLLSFIKNKHAYVLHGYYNWGYNFRVFGQSKESVKNYIKFFEYYNAHKNELSQDEKTDFFRKVSVAYGFMADEYVKIGEIDSAKVQHIRNIEHTEKNKKSIYYASALNNYGLFYYWGEKDLETALMLFNKAQVAILKSGPNDHLRGSIRDNIADIYVENKEFKKANNLYKENTLFYTQGFKNNRVDIPRLVKAHVQLIETDLALNNFVNASMHFNEFKIIASDPIFYILQRPELNLEFLKIKEQFLESQHKMKEAYLISKQVKWLSDSIKEIKNTKKTVRESAINQTVVDRIQKNYHLEKKEKEDHIAQQNLKIWIIALLGLSFIGFLSSLIIRRRHRIIIAKSKQHIAEQELQFTALKNERLNTEIKSKERDLSDFAINLTQSQDWAKSLVKKWEVLKGTKGRQRKNLMDDFEQDLQNKISYDKESSQFYERLDQLSDSFYSRLKSDYPNLSKTEKRLCSLIRLKITSNEISTLQNITLQSLNTSRYRLRKKLSLSKNADLDSFIQSL